MGETLVVGIGHPERGDDAVGHLVADALAASRPELAVWWLTDPLALIDGLAGRDLVVVVDAAVTGAPVGTVGVIEAGERALPQRVSGRPTIVAASSHGLSLGDAIELARAGGSLPARLALVTVEVRSVAIGEPPQPAVSDAVARARTAVLSLLDEQAGAASSAAPRGSAPRRRHGSRRPSR